MIRIEDLSAYEHSGECKIIIDFRNSESHVPVFRTYRYDMSFKAFLDPATGSIFVPGDVSVMGFIKQELNMPDNATISYKSTYIGKGNDIVISLECITNKSFIRKLKIETIINE